MGMQHVEEAFERWVAVHDAAGSPMSRCLRPPVDGAMVEQIASRLPAIPDDVLALHRLADGVDLRQWTANSRYPPRLVPGGPEFVDLAAAATTVEEMRSAARAASRASGMPADELWPPELGLAYPILPDECIGVDTSGGDGSLWIVRWEATDIRPLHVGVARLLDLAAERFQRLGCQWDAASGLLDYDVDLDETLAAFWEDGP